jgi:uncharacterized protein (TIGR02466 family)
MLIDIFKISVYKKILNCDITQLKEFAFWCEKNSINNKISNVGGYQSPNLSLEEVVLQDLINLLKINANIYTSTLQIKPKIKLSNMWFNINGYKDFNKSHIHTNSIVSGVFYIQTPKDCGNINFINNEEIQMYLSCEEINKFVPENSCHWVLPAIKNTCYLFPSWLKHYVEPNLNMYEKRISISFNFNIDKN